MKKHPAIFLFLFSFTGMKAQLYVQNGALLHVGGIVTLQNEDFVRSSPSGSVITFEPGSKVLFTGDGDNVISGYVDFLNLEIAKESNHRLKLLDNDEAVSGDFIFTSGFLELNNNMLLLGSTGKLVDERENSRIIGPNGGVVQARLLLNQPAGVNPGNIGAAITTAQNLGEVTISRGYLYAPGLPLNAIKRYYTIGFTDPANDANLDATLRLHYFDAELGAVDEGRLVHWKRDDLSGVWQEQGPSANITRNTTANWVQLTGIGSLSTWTLAESTFALPVTFALFNVTCRDEGTLIRWQTAAEINTDHFDVQRSVNGIDWITIATQIAAGQSSSLLSYSYSDPAPSSSTKIFYRIRSVDLDGRESYTTINSAVCGNGGAWQVWPNPAQRLVYITLELDGAYQTLVQLFDNKGSVVRQWQKKLLRGNNQFAADLEGLPAGIYHLVVTWDNDRGKKSAKIIKL